jgi:hypothetical protein
MLDYSKKDSRPHFGPRQDQIDFMTNRTLASLLVLCCVGCREFEIRKDPDLWHIDPQELRRLETTQRVTDYAPQISPQSSWQIHTTLDSHLALVDKDPSTLASSLDDHRLGESILIDLGCECRFQSVRQLHPAHGGAPPRFRVDTAGAHGFPYSLQFVGSGQTHETPAVFPRPVTARFIRISVIEDSADPWIVSELVVD